MKKNKHLLLIPIIVAVTACSSPVVPGPVVVPSPKVIKPKVKVIKKTKITPAKTRPPAKILKQAGPEDTDMYNFNAL